MSQLKHSNERGAKYSNTLPGVALLVLGDKGGRRELVMLQCDALGGYTPVGRAGVGKVYA